MDLIKLIDYDKWANQKIFSAIQHLEPKEQEPEVMQLFAHLLATQKVWMSRITGDDPGIGIWPELSFPEMEALLNGNPEKLKALILKKDEIIRYKNSKGESFNNSVEEIMMHLIIHGQHHRAQLAKLIRQVGHTPPGTDFIFFLRTVHN